MTHITINFKQFLHLTSQISKTYVQDGTQNLLEQELRNNRLVLLTNKIEKFCKDNNIPKADFLNTTFDINTEEKKLQIEVNKIFETTITLADKVRKSSILNKRLSYIGQNSRPDHNGNIKISELEGAFLTNLPIPEESKNWFYSRYEISPY